MISQLQGLLQLSVAALIESKKLLLGNLLQAVNLRENHLSSLLSVAHEIDSSDLRDNSKDELEVQKSDIPVLNYKKGNSWS